MVYSILQKSIIKDSHQPNSFVFLPSDRLIVSLNLEGRVVLMHSILKQPIVFLSVSEYAAGVRHRKMLFQGMVYQPTNECVNLYFHI